MSRKIRKSRFMRLVEDPYCDAEARFTIELELPYDLLKSIADRSVTGVDVLIMAPTELEAKQLAADALQELALVISDEVACLRKLVK